MLIKTQIGLRSSEVTDEAVWLERRDSLRVIGGILAMGVVGHSHAGAVDQAGSVAGQNGPADLSERLTPLRDVANYNNYYEFSFYKTPPSELARAMQIEPWVLEVSGL
ncbi:MAG: mononuclear molybdenum enzyme YedY, partial [Gammaproteobacteria bacterium]|nr:mononuclear molybdenum enzyme YedY [Gammaproteobacteria bacterium]